MSFDFVSLVENNPITTFKGDYKSKVIEKVKNAFTTSEQQLFLSSFYCLLNFDKEKDFVIDLDNIWPWLGFAQKVKAKVLLENNFTIGTDYKLVTKNEKNTEKLKGGQNKEIFMLNINTFKKLCLKASTKKADEIHNYFLSLEEIFQKLLLDETNELQVQLEEKNVIIGENSQEIAVLRSQINIDEALKKEAILLREFSSSGPLIYINKVHSFPDNTFVGKLGESRTGVDGRYREHKGNYEQCILLDCFSVERSREFEQFLLNHEAIRKNKVRNLPGHENENELILFGKDLSYKSFLKIVNKNIKNFQNVDYNTIMESFASLKTLLEANSLVQSLPSQLEKFLEPVLLRLDAIEKQNKEILERLSRQDIKTVTGFQEPLSTVGPRVQKINPETRQIVKVYESASEAMKENVEIKRPSLTKAILECTIYYGFRWMNVERNLDPNVLYNFQTTRETRQQNLGYIAQLNEQRSKILNVYLDRKTAATLNGFSSSAALDNPVRNFTLARGFYYKLYDECDAELVTAFEEKYGKEPLLYKDGFGMFNEKGELVKEFKCKYDCIRSEHISDKTIAKSMERNMPYNGITFRSLGEKLSCY
jgi:phage anti-repressor protein